ncbi:hypothetical protein L1987_35051 [Smallanthus sonchifolius]|uniref:Uncharacterized protein n=1 Tax=Smallanthus sonchifolius TaxID=185202 RepID=A0ACB9HUX8_9ASTR|nr:hypothetical protein L1987_35051 [Smallanthus sonchifolius]
MLSRKSKANNWTWTFRPSSKVGDQEMWECCEKWGSVVDIYIARKMTKKERKVEEDRMPVMKGNRGITQFRWLESASSSSFASVLVGEKKNHHVHPGKIVVLDKKYLKVIKDHANVVLGCVNDVQSMANLFRVCKQEGFMDVEIVYVGGKWVWMEFQSSMTSSKFKRYEGIKYLFMEFREVLKSYVVNDSMAWSILGRVYIRTNEKNVIRENVSVNIEEKMYQVRVNEFVSWVPSFNKIEEFESKDEESSNNGDRDSVETQSNEESFGHVVQDFGNEMNKEVLNLKSDSVDAVNLEDFTLVVNDKSKVDQVTTVLEFMEHVVVELVVPS